MVSRWGQEGPRASGAGIHCSLSFLQACGRAQPGWGAHSGVRSASRSSVQSSGRGRSSRGEEAGRSPHLLFVRHATRSSDGRDPPRWRPLRSEITGSSVIAAPSGAPFSRNFRLCLAVIAL
ncbi:hypothetical protein NDU88_000585 [Pleurodeles waltl]|uniref:Uncharacterized protein n=1 Tax=Pleurodeles waltl TaxID=8319 RepID=A0AAV7R4L2_PLEWA|nr:hypothetical protein NDU88_000585 [Pleurodeles waltl]